MVVVLMTCVVLLLLCLVVLPLHTHCLATLSHEAGVALPHAIFLQSALALQAMAATTQEGRG